VTIELVARPVVLGEDPGLLSDLSDTSGMGLTLLWFALAVAWAIWRLLSRRGVDRQSAGKRQAGGLPRGDWLASAVEWGLFLIVAAMFVSAEKAARNHFSARLVAWEWLGMFLAFWVVRRVAVSAEVQQRLLTVLLAGAVASSVNGIYQAAIELPRLRADFTDVEKLRAELAKQHMNLSPDDPFFVAMVRRIQENHISGTYAHPNSYAGYLVLLIPGLIGAAVLAYKKQRRGPATAVAVCAILGLTALWLTHSRGGLLAIAGVAVGFMLMSRTCRQWLWQHRLAAAAGALLLVAAGVGASLAGLWSKGIGKEEGTVQLRLLYWRTTLRIIQQHPWLGVGPANFGNAYAQAMEDIADEKIKDPHNFALELWSSAGVVAVAAGVTVFAAFFLRMLRSLRAPAAEDDEPLSERTRWEYYVGGIFGLLLGFVLRVENADQSTILSEAVAAGIRSVAWFAAFGLLEHLHWPPRARAVVLTTGVAALLVNLCVSGGISFPAVAVLLWTAMALALNALPAAGKTAEAASARAAASWPAALAAPVLAGITLVYLLYVFYPVTSAMSLEQQALTHGQFYWKQQGALRGPVARSPESYIQSQIVKPLEDARKLTPDDPRPCLQIAPWYAELWRRSYDPGAVRPSGKEDTPEQKAVMACAAVAHPDPNNPGKTVGLDPDNPSGYLAKYYLHAFFAWQLELEAQRRAEQASDPKTEPAMAERLRESVKKHRIRSHEEYGIAAESLVPCLRCDPTELKVRYLRAEALGLAGRNVDAANLGREALEYDGGLTRVMRRLSGRERRDLMFLIPEIRQPLLAGYSVLAGATGITGVPAAWEAGREGLREWAASTPRNLRP
jgi:hypothetical protein